MQKFQKISLSDHCDLGKLPCVKPDDLLDLLVCLPFLPLIFPAVREDQAHPGSLLYQTGRAVRIFPFSRTHIFRISPNRILSSAVRKNVLHVGVRIPGSILAAHHIAVAHASARPVIERIRDGVKNGRLSRSGISRDQEKASLHLSKINDLRPGIRTERRHRKPYRSHRASPFALSYA